VTDVVSKKFKTVNRCFEVGDPVSPSDIEGALSFDEWKNGGFIKDDAATAASTVEAAPALSSGVSKQD
jgi:hypothetical protein